MYLYNSERTGKKGRPKTYDGKINFREQDSDKVTKVDLFPDEDDFYTTIAYSKSLKKNLRMVVFMPLKVSRNSISPPT